MRNRLLVVLALAGLASSACSAADALATESPRRAVSWSAHTEVLRVAGGAPGESLPAVARLTEVPLPSPPPPPSANVTAPPAVAAAPAPEPPQEPAGPVRVPWGNEGESDDEAPPFAPPVRVDSPYAKASPSKVLVKVRRGPCCGGTCGASARSLSLYLQGLGGSASPGLGNASFSFSSSSSSSGARIAGGGLRAR